MIHDQSLCVWLPKFTFEEMVNRERALRASLASRNHVTFPGDSIFRRSCLTRDLVPRVGPLNLCCHRHQTPQTFGDSRHHVHTSQLVEQTYCFEATAYRITLIRVSRYLYVISRGKRTEGERSVVTARLRPPSFKLSQTNACRPCSPPRAGPRAWHPLRLDLGFHTSFGASETDHVKHPVALKFRPIDRRVHGLLTP